MDERILNIGLIGCGRAGMIHGRNFASKVKRAAMFAVADVSEGAATAAAQELGAPHAFTDYRDMLKLDALDAVVVVSPTDLHKPIVLAAAAAGKHVFCEKPMAMNVADCEAMVEGCDKHGVKLQIGFMRRHDKSYQAAKQKLDEGAIGELVLVKSFTRGPSKPRPWMYDLKQSNGILAEVNSHDIDVVRWFAGSDIARLFAQGGNFRNPEAAAQYPDYYDSMTMTGVFQNGVQFMIDGAAYVQYGYDTHLELVGTKGVLRVGRDEGMFYQCATPGVGKATPFVNSWMTLFEDAYLREDTAFTEAVLNDTPPLVTGYDGMMAVKVVEAGNRSIESGAVIAL